MAYADNEQVRFIDRIRAITFREARDAGTSFISRTWVAKQIKRSENFVKLNWNRNPYDCAMETANIGLGGRQFSGESRRILVESSGRQRKRVRKMAAVLEEEREKPRNRETVRRELHRLGFKAFHVIKKPMQTALSRENRVWFCQQMRLWALSALCHIEKVKETIRDCLIC
jgi:hypothetical protein